MTASGRAWRRMESAQAGGMMAVIGSLIGHIVYGATLGALASWPATAATRPASA